MWGLAEPLSSLVRRWNFTNLVTAACVALYVLALLFDPNALAGRGALNPLSALSLFSPTDEALWRLGAAGAIPWRAGRWWTLLTATYLHGGLLHILFNLLWVRQLAPAVSELYGPARVATIFTVAGVAGFAASTLAGTLLTVGASGAVFGLLGAMVAYGHRRGGAFGSMILRQYGQWAAILFLFGLLPGTRIDNWAHAGGFVGGFAMGWLLSLAERRTETGNDRLLALLLVGLTALGFVLALWHAF